MKVYVFPCLLVLFALWVLLLAFRRNRREGFHASRKIAVAAGGLLLLSLAWATARSLPPLSPPVPKGILHAPAGFFSKTASRPAARARPSPPENPVYLVQAFVALFLKDGLHPVLCAEKRLPWPEEKDKPQKFHLTLGPAAIDFDFKLVESPEIEDPKLRAWLGPDLKEREIEWNLKFGRPGSSSTIGGMNFGWRRSDTLRLYFAAYWKSTHDSLSEALVLAPRPSLPYTFILAVLPVGRNEKLDTVEPKREESYLDTLLARAPNLKKVKTSGKEEAIPAIPRGIELARKAPGITALAFFVPAAVTLLLALLLAAQAFRRPYPAFLLLAFLSLLFMAGLDRSVLRRNLDVLRDAEAALPDRILAARWAEDTFFFRRLAVREGVSLAGDRALPEAARKAAASLGRIYVPSSR